MTPVAELAAAPGIELWGGVECTVNRIGDQWFSQLERNGHACRREDLDRFAELGVRSIRYPVLWERTAPRHVQECDWSWPDDRLARLHELGVEPIVGLLHHGSGPGYTSLVDPGFSEKLRAYAAQVARRYPWVARYTPVNEPLTTARFSGLYGVWYPHARDEHSFRAALFNQCRGTVLAMRAIRAVNPSAQLVQTEDLGKTYSPPSLAYQTDFNNRMRWLCWDLLAGRVDRDHPLRDWLIGACGASAAELDWFVGNACAPDILGVNHYITSERFLDPDIAAYPVQYHGGNGRDRYADIEAARCVAQPTGGIESLLQEAWERYRIPIAITEVHIDSTRDDQIRWLARVWRAAEAARAGGVDVRAVTVWALLGSYDWNCLVTENRGYYEPGAFDVRGPQPRPTALAATMRSLADGRLPAHPVLDAPGWWERADRFAVRPVGIDGRVQTHGAGAAATAAPHPALDGFALVRADAGDRIVAAPRDAAPRADGGFAAPILVTGATGTLGSAFARICTDRGLDFRLVSRQSLDIADADSIELALDRHRPWAVINTAGYVRVDDAETDVERCFRENAIGPALLAAACERHRIPLVTFSSDLVFDGRRDHPYVETDRTAPLNVYGRSKAEAEQRVLDRHAGAMVVRTSAFFGPWDRHNFLSVLLGTLEDGGIFTAASDLTVSPTYVPDLVHACLDLLIDGETGIWHLSNGGSISWAELALRAARMAGKDDRRVMPCRHEALALRAKRPTYSALGTGRTAVMPTLDSALDRYFHHYHAPREVSPRT